MRARVAQAIAAAPTADIAAPSPPRSGQLSSVLKLFAWVTIAGCIIAAVWMRWSNDAPPRGVPSAAAATAVHSLPPPPSPSLPTGVNAATTASSDVPTLDVWALPSVMPSSKRTPSTLRSPRSLEEETRLLRAAARAQQAGDGDGSLAILSEHEARFPDGVLRDERTVAKIAALCALGRKETASSEARRFLRGRERSPLTLRVEASCAGQQP
jgi:hypothetical protein